jgi:hypothetical protein
MIPKSIPSGLDPRVADFSEQIMLKIKDETAT